MLNTHDKTYAEIFARRAACYDEAMRMFPDARKDEFKALLAWANIDSNDIVLDIPSGGGYLSSLLGQHNARLIQIDPSHIFAKLSKQQDSAAETIQSSLNKLPLISGSVTTIISMVGLHHEYDRVRILSEWLRVISSDGRLLMAEVDDHSEVAAFLNEFVDRYNPLGHQGLFVNANFLDQIQTAGWKIIRSELTETCWRFADLQSASKYFRMLFDLQLADEETTIGGIEKYLGVSQESNEVSINWPLRQLLLTK